MLLYTSNEQTGNEFKKAIPLIVKSERILWSKSSKISVNYKMSLKKKKKTTGEVLNKWKDMFVDGKTQC